jgi:ATP-binding cassette, subfamily B, bacterial
MPDHSTVQTLEPKPSTAGTFRAAWPYLRAHRGIVAAAIVLSLASTFAVVMMAPAVGFATDALVDRNGQRLWVGVALFVVLVVARMLLLRNAEIALTRAGERFVRDLRERAVRHLAAAPLRFIEAHRSGDLLRRTTGEITDMAGFIRQDLPDLVAAAATSLLTAIVLFTYSPLLALVVIGVFAVPMMAISRWFSKDAGDAYGGEAAAEATVVATFAEGLAAREMLLQTGSTKSWIERAQRDSDSFLSAVRNLVRVENRLHLVALVEGLTMAVLLLFAGWLAVRGSITVGTVVVFVLASRNLFESLTQLVELVSRLQSTRVNLARLLNLLNVTSAGQPSARSADEVVPPRGELVATGVRYSYVPNVEVLHDISVRFSPGTRTGLAGRTGSGKSTLAKILTGLYVPDSGTVRFAGLDVTEIPVDVLRRRVVLVPQQVHVVAGSLADNLALVPVEPSRADVERAVASLELSGWVQRLPAGLDTELGSRGESLSAGERQLIGLIRAALVDPAVLILDEATADIDPDTAARIETALDRLRADRVLIVIAHREATIERLPSLIRLDEGRVV